MTVQFVEIAGQKIAMLSAADYEHLLEMAEDRADELAADRASARRLAGEEYVPVELIDRIIGGESPLRVWRTYRGMTQDALAEKVGTAANYISLIENGQREGKAALWRKLAEALKVDVDDILPDA
jgi:DNA-binding XRE family transcriptional regulator